MLRSNPVANWISWVSRHPNDFLLTSGTLITGLATVALAIVTIVLYRGNLHLIALNTKQFNRRFLSQVYKDLLKLMIDTLQTIRIWIADLQKSTQGFVPGSTVSREELERQRDVAIRVGIKMDLFPNVRINPLSNAWMKLLSEGLQEFANLYKEEDRDEDGNYRIADDDRFAAIERLLAIATNLDSQREEIAKAMSVELSL